MLSGISSSRISTATPAILKMVAQRFRKDRASEIPLIRGGTGHEFGSVLFIIHFDLL